MNSQRLGFFRAPGYGRTHDLEGTEPAFLEMVRCAGDNLFPSLRHFDPATYQRDRSKLPYQVPAELQRVKAAQAIATPREIAWAKHLARVGATALWMSLAAEYRARPDVSWLKGWWVTGQVASAVTGQALITHLAKTRTQSPRPFQLDPTVKNYGRVSKTYSFPSGHTASSAAAATVLSAHWPQRKQELMSLAKNVGRSRVLIGAHFPGDVAAGFQDVGVPVGCQIVGCPHPESTFGARTSAVGSFRLR